MGRGGVMEWGQQRQGGVLNPGASIKTQFKSQLASLGELPAASLEACQPACFTWEAEALNVASYSICLTPTNNRHCMPCARAGRKGASPRSTLDVGGHLSESGWAQPSSPRLLTHMWSPEEQAETQEWDSAEGEARGGARGVVGAHG